MHKENSQRPPVLQHVSQNVRRLRNSADLSQTALAEKSGVSRRMLVAIEAGEKKRQPGDTGPRGRSLGSGFQRPDPGT